MDEGPRFDELDPIAQRVIKMIAHHTGQRTEEVTPDAFIDRDLGCAGQDAAVLMGRLADEFDSDMRGVVWERHFSARGGRGWPLLVALVVAAPLSAVGMIVTGWALQAAGRGGLGGPAWLFGAVYLACFVLVALITIFLPRGRAVRARIIPITVQDVIDAARLGAWPFPGRQGYSS